MNLRILLIGNYPPDQQKSMAAFTQMIAKSLNDDGHTTSIVTPTARLLPRHKKPSGFWKWVGYIDKFILFPWVLRQRAKEFDLIHICDHSNAMYAMVLQKKPTIVTCHDVLAIEAARDFIPGWRVGMIGKLFQKLIFKGLNHATGIVCVSAYTKTHLHDLGCTVGAVTVALNSFNDDFAPAAMHMIVAATNYAGLPPVCSYFVHVGSNLPRKNRLFVLQVFNEIRRLQSGNDFKLLFIGPPLPVDIERYVADNGLLDVVFSIQNVSHETLNALYSGAAALIFPSLQEGFGWPIIEAQACGCPVFTSNLLPMTEVGGSGAIYINPYEPLEAANTICQSLPQRAMIKQRGFENVTRFAMQQMMSDYYLAYRCAMESFK